MERIVLADSDHPAVAAKALEIAGTATNDKERIEGIFGYVRDGVVFGFPVKGDLVRASETIRSGIGQCNTKSTLFLALCRALGMKARIHFSTVTKEIQRGLFPRLAYSMIPDSISHSWIEVHLEGRWIRIDSYINDIGFYTAGKRMLRENRWDTGYSISCANGDSSPELNLGEERFVQMGAVREDHGVWDEPMEYYRSGRYRNRPSPAKLFLYGLLIGRVNNKVASMRAAYSP